MTLENALNIYLKRKLHSCKYYGNLVWMNLFSFRFKRSEYIVNDTELLQRFSTTNDELKKQCDYLAKYLAEAFKHYSMADYNHAYYPGSPSQHGKKIDALEAVSRFLPTLVTYFNQISDTALTDHKTIQLINGSQLDIPNLLQRCFLSGTEPDSKTYWGDVTDNDQRICESADLALSLWLSKSYMWDQLNTQQQQQIIHWLEPICKLKTADNNWYLFTLTVQFVLSDLTGKNYIDISLLQRVGNFLVGDGWFRDGKHGDFDYYNAWGFYYSLYWLEQIKPGFSDGLVRNKLAEFTNNYRYFFTSEGIPLFGRSGCYRMAASAPLLAAMDLGTDKLVIGEAKRAFANSMRYFIQQGSVCK